MAINARVDPQPAAHLSWLLRAGCLCILSFCEARLSDLGTVTNEMSVPIINSFNGILVRGANNPKTLTERTRQITRSADHDIGSMSLNGFKAYASVLHPLLHCIHLQWFVPCGDHAF